MDRYTVRDARYWFGRLADALGKSIGPAYTRLPDGTFREHPGTWRLDYAPIYGGVTIAEITEHGGERRPFGSRRLSLREFCTAVQFTLDALDIAERTDPRPLIPDPH